MKLTDGLKEANCECVTESVGQTCHEVMEMVDNIQSNLFDEKREESIDLSESTDKSDENIDEVAFNEKIKQRNRQHLLTVQNLREQELYRSKINFYTDVAHEIRTPLTLIKAPLEKLMDKVDHNPVTDKLLLTMQNNTEKLIALSNQLLDFRQVETEGFKLHFESENISQTVQEIINNFTVTLQAQGKQIVSHIMPDIIGQVDIDAFDKICYNLLNNALKYSSSYIEVNLNMDKQKNIFILTVKNDGALIPSEERERIFEPFNRLKQNKNVPGSGLGLALTRSLTLKHQGTLLYSTNDLQLNVFSLTLPLNHNTNP
jgi:signal transduction histidine kinase